MKSSSANLIPENLLADHKKRLMSEGEVTLHERELITKIRAQSKRRYKE